MTAKRAGPFLCQIRQKRLTWPELPVRDSGRLRVQQGGVDALAVVRNRTHIPRADPPLDRTGSGDLESVAGYLVMAVLGRRSCTTMRCPVFRRFFPGSFERLSHAAVNFQSLFVRASRDSRFCSPNEQ